ncbi:uncharacterized protein N7498_010799 [Penicillium cinerascens]|uniref:5'-3' DNA helicase ZGRF1-like N-terminal domain-containing protein n=1 Tax=Penicillium cinerascens TaxID=70096 RepID=A0A9W9M7P1_9EURO|nr:uncharacterized protein N7498_010799 [Penicillium cinerascens]KAJ5191814.1 hypothetical protein N7498_010799 [Penicillium cinerascens]
MSTPLSSARPGPGPTSQSQSQSQATASVVKFRCLYTHDLRRKSKRWQDGYLRYHAFNKRVMVYDEQGNYIGDHHWRSAEEIQDGDELELDKGALIQVGERMSTTQTDLSNLFEKRKSSQGSPQSNDPASQALRASTPIRSSGSSQPFRSLNDLLGIKKTPIGHLVSPYEERHPPPPSSDISLPSQRAPKRQKVTPMQRPVVSNRNAPAEVVDLTEPEEIPPAAKVRNVAKTREMPRPQNPEPIPQPRPEKLREAPKATKPQRSEPPKPSIAPEKIRGTPRQTEPQRPEPPQFVKPSMPLEKSRQAPKATKPQVAEPAEFTNPFIPPEKQRDVRNTTNTRRPEPPTFVKPSLPPPSASSSRLPNATVPPAAKDAQSEPLGLRKLPNENLQRMSRPISNTSSFEAPVKTLRMGPEKPRRKLMYSALLPSDTSQKSSPSPSNPPPERSKPMPKNLDSQAVNTPAQELNSTNAEFSPSDSTQFILDAMADGSNLGTTMTQPCNLPARRALDAPLRKSVSDPTTLTAQRTLQSRPTLMRSAMSAVPEQPEVNEEGPWTSEALDLFDFWPLGRPKPS